MHGLIPFACKFVPCNGVPPVRVEASVRKAGELCKSIANALEDDVEDEEVVDHEGKDEVECCREEVVGS